MAFSGLVDKWDVLPFLRKFCRKHPDLAPNLIWPDAIRRKSSRPETLCGKNLIPRDVSKPIPVPQGLRMNLKSELFERLSGIIGFGNNLQL